MCAYTHAWIMIALSLVSLSLFVETTGCIAISRAYAPCILLIRLMSERNIGRAMDHDHIYVSMHQAFPEHFHVWHAAMAINWVDATEEDLFLT